MIDSSNSAQQTQLHGVFLRVYGAGVLLIAAAGVGKSEIALELITRGHRLIADDVVEFFLNDNRQLVGSSPALLQDFLEVRGLGALNIRAMFGAQAILPNQSLDLIVMLIPTQGVAYISENRLATDLYMTPVLAEQVPTINLPLAVGRNMALLVEVAVRQYNLLKEGINSAEQFSQRQREMMQAKK